ncbi:conserved phage C-terminal domain-containing protein [Paenilisteria newyorkensis]|uniref:conserved phage C-terminal domain-containing protein n=1 Tax=Listeria newyorkensis TaxID=1497681 RepID=UPI00066A055D|nr:conserved phage C-terminal domain-containing protein [Listeria newyorkensis]KMT58927.1 hypothetical protein X559_2933 [Listeria newyorkensis]
MDQIKNKWAKSFFQVPNAIYDKFELDVYELAILQYMFRLSNEGNSFPSTRAIARALKCSRQKVIDTLEELIKKNYLKKTPRRSKNGSQKTNLYTLLDPDVVGKKGGTPDVPPPVPDVDGGGLSDVPPPVHDVDKGGLPDGQGVVYEAGSMFTHTNITHTNYKDIVDFLNINAGTKYRETTKKTETLIKARLKEGFTVEDFKTVILNKCRSWKNDPKMASYLRPKTLFSADNFESYLNEKPVQRKAGEPDVTQPLSRRGENDIEIREIDIDDLPF